MAINTMSVYWCKKSDSKYDKEHLLQQMLTVYKDCLIYIFCVLICFFYFTKNVYSKLFLNSRILLVTYS
jgi:hypothetical protein